MAEGIIKWISLDGQTAHYGVGVDDFWALSPKSAFARLWDSINTKRGYCWEFNPWVWVVEFKRVKT